MPSVGLIRWNGWNNGPFGLKESLMLSPPHWRNKCPFYTVVNSANSVSTDSDTAAIAEAQNVHGAALGVDHWVFHDYPTDPRLGLGPGLVDIAGFGSALVRYQASSNKSLVKFCLQIGGHFVFASGAFASGDWSANVSRYVSIMQDSQYKKVLTNRPLFYFYFSDSFVSAMGGLSAAQTGIQQLRDAATGAGLGNPYIVLLDGDQLLGGDAVSNYAVFLPNEGLNELAYSVVTNSAEGQWTSWDNSNKKMVPLASMGWDQRPRVSPDYYGGSLSYSSYNTPATRAQKLAHIQAAADFVTAHSTNCESGAVLVYAWDEFSEGGYLCPTLPPVGSGLTSNRLGSGVLL